MLWLPYVSMLLDVTGQEDLGMKSPGAIPFENEAPGKRNGWREGSSGLGFKEKEQALSLNLSPAEGCTVNVTGSVDTQNPILVNYTW
ncbi:unnamed protein product [Allacma fusca]|uniref:Uncharacterized protein n=1 Tax=Allacma fusca TaxID=39272 RepID=A0A8J2KMF4_9HEXA|nr:unnamed protein product [Allacma fusca]